MKVLIITQVFWPDTASTAQHLTDLAVELTSNGHDVTVLTSKYAYEDTTIKFPPFEIFQGVKIKRIRNTGFGKKTITGRLTDFASFNALLFLRLLFLRRRSYDIIMGMTSPPLISYFGIIISRIKKIKFFYWTMDLQPELAIASGLIRKSSIAAKSLSYIGNYTIKRSQKIFALDSYMQSYLLGKGATVDKISLIPVWSVLESRYSGSRMDNPFRIHHQFGDKTIVMYSGNHAYVHPLDTLLQAALQLKDNNEILFVFIGGGVRKKDVTEFKEEYKLENIIQLPYQPRNNIHNSLAAADIQVVIMGEEQVGYTHPNKIYGSMFAAKPILYIGPATSHVSDILLNLEGNISVQHGEAEQLAAQILAFSKLKEGEKEAIGKQNFEYVSVHFEPARLKQMMRKVFEQNA
jgi:colanic acid biosynthesis glycosyl transferase WcaI